MELPLTLGVISALTWNAAAFSRAPPLFAALFALAGLPASAMVVGLITAIQRATPPAYLGRVMATADSLGLAGAAIGSITAGVTLDHLNITILLDLQASLYLATGAIALRTLVLQPQPQPQSE